MERYTIDRIVDGKVVLLLKTNEDIQHIVPLEDLPVGIKEGNILNAQIKGDKVIKVVLDADATESQKKKIEDKLQKLLKRKK